MKVCKYCKSDIGYYIVETIKRSLLFSTDDMLDEIADHIISSSNIKRCTHCDKKWTPIEVEE